MQELLQTRALFFNDSTGLVKPADFTSTGDKLFIQYPKPVRVYRWGFFAGNTFTHAATCALTLENRPVIGSDTNRAVVDTMNLFAAAQDLVAGQANFNTLVLPVAATTNSDGSVSNVGGSGPYVLLPGAQLVLKINTAGAAAGTANWGFIEFVELPYDIDVRASLVPALSAGLYSTNMKRQS